MIHGASKALLFLSAVGLQGCEILTPSEDCRFDSDCSGAEVCAYGSCTEPYSYTSTPTVGSGGVTPQPGDCTELTPLVWTGTQACFRLNDFELALLAELTTVWKTAPSTICSYDGSLGGQGPCGVLLPGNAFYCGVDQSIGWDVPFMNYQFSVHGDFAAVTVLAHEWGHLNQDLTQYAFMGTKAGELHADCQAGIFAAIEEDRGNLNVGDVCEAFSTLVSAGDPVYTPWFQPQQHGTAAERVASFERGYFGALQNLDALCGNAPLSVMRALCD